MSLDRALDDFRGLARGSEIDLGGAAIVLLGI